MTAVLATIAGTLLVLAGIMITLVVPVTVVTSIEGSSQETVSTATPVASVIVLALVPASLGVAHLVTASGLLNAKRWAWNAAQVLSVIAIAVSAVMIILSGNLLMAGNIVIGGAILYYLQSKKVKQYFGITTH
ncbi:MAG TPA: hypothetical protein VFZ05_01605 [Nitrososphaera sp.]